MSMDTLSFVMIFCDGMSMVTVRKLMRTIRSRIGMTRMRPGPRVFRNRPRKKMTARSYSFTTLMLARRTATTNQMTPVSMSMGILYNRNGEGAIFFKNDQNAVG